MLKLICNTALKHLQRSTLKSLAIGSLFLATSSVTMAASNVIDVLVVYTPGTASLYGGDPTTRFNQIFQFTNQVYRDSNIDLEIRIARTLQVNYTDDNNAETALRDMSFNQNAAFSGVAAAREQAKADMVVLYRPYKDIHGSCGIAWVGGGSNGDFSNPAWKQYMFAHVAVNTCGDYVTAHELGHNMGLKHSRKQDGTGGAFPYALGYGVNGQFTTIMAYQTSFNVDYWTGKVYKFSSPEYNCKGVPCGISRTDAANGADARYALTITSPQVANFYAGAPASSSSSVASSSSSSSERSSSSSSSRSSVSNTELNAALERVTRARAAVEQAKQALANNKAAIAEKTKLESAAKSALEKATKDLTSARSKYEAAVKKFNESSALVQSLQSQVAAALTVLNNSTDKTREANRKKYNELVTKYNAAQQKYTESSSAVTAAQNLVSSATTAVQQATSAYNTAKQNTDAVKALTSGLETNVTNAQAALKSAEDAYKALVSKTK